MNSQIRGAAKAALAATGWSQQEVARRARVKQATVSRLLTGERQGEPDTWNRILDVLGLELMAVPKGTDLEQISGKGRPNSGQEEQ